jgi:hypothetical protein
VNIIKNRLLEVDAAFQKHVFHQSSELRASGLERGIGVRVGNEVVGKEGMETRIGGRLNKRSATPRSETLHMREAIVNV